MIDKRHFIAYKTYFIGFAVIVFILFVFGFRGSSTPIIYPQKEEVLSTDDDDFDTFVSQEHLVGILQKDTNGENFADFFDRFTSDPSFQLSRVKFPVGDRAYKIDKISITQNLEDDPDFDMFWNDFVRYEDISKENWQKLSPQHFVSNAAIANSYPSGWIYYGEKSVAFLKGFLHSDDFEYMLNFEKIDDKWYLVEYKDGVLWEE